MRAGFHLLAVLLAATLASAPAMGRSDDNTATHQRMAAAGFTPLAEMTFGGRDVHRVLPMDPYGILGVPGIELERHADGHVTLRAQYKGWTGEAYAVSQAEWDRLTDLERAAYAPPGKSTFNGKPGVIVHCWSGLIESSPGNAASWWACDDGTRAARSYTEAVLDLAMQKMSCTDGGDDTLWRFSRCSASSYTLDDPALQERLTRLREQWKKQREPGAEILATARLTLRAAHTNRTAAQIGEAQKAVLAFGRQQEALRAIVQSSFTSLPELDESDGRNGVILAQVRRAWQQDIEGQDRNYIDLLEKLTQLAIGPAKSAN